MDRNYVLGVDGGNSKTDYFLFGTDGSFVDHLRDGTCSHEQFSDGYDSALRILRQRIYELCGRNGIAAEQLAAGAFGLAGVDVPIQRRTLEEGIRKIGLTRFEVDNDSFLGVKAGTTDGYGVCSINGSGTVTGGIDRHGGRLQIGGIGSDLSGDEAGGYFLARKTLRAVYDHLYRMEPPTLMTEPVMKLLGITDKYHYLESVSRLATLLSMPARELMGILFSCADAGDGTAISIVENSSRQLAKSAAGCIRNLDFGSGAEVVLAGSVWVKAETALLLDKFKEVLSALVPQIIRYHMLQVPPATGAVLWALELAKGGCAEAVVKGHVIEAVEKACGLK